MEAQAIAQADYLDILFDNRNKKYGGYVLRKYQDQRMMKALLLIVGCCITLVTLAILPRGKEVKNVVMVTPPIVLTDADEIIPKPPKPIPPETRPALPETVPTIQNPLPVISPDEVVTNTPPPVDSFAGRESGPVTAEGDPIGSSVTTNTTKPTGNSNVVSEPPAEPVIYAEQMPEFKGDIYSYLGRSVHYPQQAIQANIEGKVLIQFVVNEDGAISRTKVLRGIGGGCDEEALRVVSAMPAWKPGKQNGKAVKVFFTLPITFRLQ
ncbi:MAG: energy transducer TonB [Chitinophagaceae bacterium]|nr:energy transducer TonB [Chitinophagaceae bacterium]MCB9046815.1 energy transducer TonB [Chitinophagales bacterium]